MPIGRNLTPRKPRPGFDPSPSAELGPPEQATDSPQIDQAQTAAPVRVRRWAVFALPDSGLPHDTSMAQPGRPQAASLSCRAAWA